jgi:hypothetical protein
MWFRLSRIAPGTVITAIIVIMVGRLARHHPLRRQSPLSVKRLMWLLDGEIRTTGRPVVIIRPFPRPLVATAHWHLHRLPVQPLPRPSVPLIPTDLFRLDSWHHSFCRSLDSPSKKNKFCVVFLVFFHIFGLIIKIPFLFSCLVWIGEYGLSPGLSAVHFTQAWRWALRRLLFYG